MASFAAAESSIDTVINIRDNLIFTISSMNPPQPGHVGKLIYEMIYHHKSSEILNLFSCTYNLSSNDLCGLILFPKAIANLSLIELLIKERQDVMSISFLFNDLMIKSLSY